MVLHGLRVTVISRLLEPGNRYAAEKLRKEHCDLQFFAGYQSLRGRLKVEHIQVTVS